jgi:hypothetical protein
MSEKTWKRKNWKHNFTFYKIPQEIPKKPTIFEAQLVLGAARENVKLELSDTPAISNTLWY